MSNDSQGVDAQAVIQHLANKIAALEVNIAVLSARLSAGEAEEDN